MGKDELKSGVRRPGPGSGTLTRERCHLGQVTQPLGLSFRVCENGHEDTTRLHSSGHSVGLFLSLEKTLQPCRPHRPLGRHRDLAQPLGRKEGPLTRRHVSEDGRESWAANSAHFSGKCQGMWHFLQGDFKGLSVMGGGVLCNYSQFSSFY